MLSFHSSTSEICDAPRKGVLLTFLSAVAIAMLLASSTQARASQLSASSNLKPNVLMRYGVQVSPRESVDSRGFSNLTSLNTTHGPVLTRTHGVIVVGKSSMHIKTIRHEKITGIKAEYQVYGYPPGLDFLNGSTQYQEWNGEGNLPFRYKYGEDQYLKFTVLVVEAHLPGYPPFKN